MKECRLKAYHIINSGIANATCELLKSQHFPRVYSYAEISRGIWKTRISYWLTFCTLVYFGVTTRTKKPGDYNSWWLFAECWLDLHEVADVLAVREDLWEVLGAEDVAESGLGEQTRRPVGVLDVRDWYRGVRHTIVDDGVDGDRHWVFRQDLHQPHASNHYRLASKLLSYSRREVDPGCAFGTVIWGREAVGARWPMRCYYSKERTGSLEALRCDHCTISNHSAATCHRMFPTLKSTGSGSLWDKILGGMDGRCNANFKAIWEAHGTVVCKRNRSISFAVLHNAWTWQTDRQTDRPLSGNIDTNRRNRFQWCRV